MKQFVQNEEAVSPVIGVILMVAITVILAAVIAAFVFGMAGGVQSSKSVAATGSQSGTDIFVTYQGGPDHNSVTNLTVTAPNGTTYWYDSSVAGANLAAARPSTAADGEPTVGSVMLLSGAGTTEKNHVTAAAIFDDGTTQVILDTFV